MVLAPYITLAEIKAYLDGAEEGYADPVLEGYILAASEAVSAFVNRDYGPGIREEHFSGRGGAAHFPRAQPIASVTQLLHEDKPIAAKIVQAREAVARADGGFFEGEFTLTYVTTAPVPEDVKLATKMTAQAMLESGPLDKNLTGYQAGGVMAGGYDQGGPGYIPRGALSLLSEKRRWF